MIFQICMCIGGTFQWKWAYSYTLFHKEIAFSLQIVGAIQTFFVLQFCQLYPSSWIQILFDSNCFHLLNRIKSTEYTRYWYSTLFTLTIVNATKLRQIVFVTHSNGRAVCVRPQIVWSLIEPSFIPHLTHNLFKVNRFSVLSICVRAACFVSVAVICVQLILFALI